MQEVEDYKESTILLGATTLRNTLGQGRQAVIRQLSFTWSDLLSK